MAAFLSGLWGQGLFAKCRPKPVKYGVPNPAYDKRVKPQPQVIIADEDSVPKQDTIQPEVPDTTRNMPPPPDIPVCKYGPPSDWW